MKTGRPIANPHAVLGVLFVVHCLLAAWFASLTPYRTSGRMVFQSGAAAADIGAPDERQHANYVQRLLDGRGFGKLDPSDSALYENYQNHQPPAYYLVAAGFCKLIGAQNLSSPEGAKLRFLNVLIGGTTVAGVYFLCIWSIGRQDLALASASFAALLPMNVALSGAISNDPMLFSLSTWTLALLARGIGQSWTWRIVIAIGAFAGLAVLTKSTAVALLPAIAAAYFASRRSDSLVRPATAISVMMAICLSLALPWWARNVSLYGDPLAISAFNEAFVGSPPASAFIEELGAYAYWTQWVGWWTLRSLVGVFGYMDIFLPNAIYVVALVAVFGFWANGTLALNREDSASARRSLWPSWCFLFAVALLFVRFNLQFFQGQARYLFPAIAPWAILYGMGATRSKKFGRPIAISMTAFLALVSIYAGMRLRPEFEIRISSAWNGELSTGRQV